MFIYIDLVSKSKAMKHKGGLKQHTIFLTRCAQWFTPCL